jgi:hypothetical protein
MAGTTPKTKVYWVNTLGTEKIYVIECLDSGSRPIWIKFEPVDKSKPMEVCNILDQPSEVNWAIKNSHFETIDGKTKGNYYSADMAGSLRVDKGITPINKEQNSKIVLFPIDKGGSISVLDYSLTGSQFRIEANMPLWVGYVVSGSGSISPISP